MELSPDLKNKMVEARLRARNELSQQTSTMEKIRKNFYRNSHLEYYYFFELTNRLNGPVRNMNNDSMGPAFNKILRGLELLLNSPYLKSAAHLLMNLREHIHTQRKTPKAILEDLATGF